jgi:hypothetical protein
MPDYHAVFQRDDSVRIAPREELERQPKGPWPYSLTDDQFRFANCDAVVEAISYYHGGLVLYELRHVPGFWLEDLLLDATLYMAAGARDPRPCDYFVIESLRNDQGGYAVIRDRNGIECLKVRSANEEVTRDAIKAAASRLHILTFQHRYGFVGTYEFVKGWEADAGIAP